MNYAEDLFDDVRHLLVPNANVRIRYLRLGRLFDRLLKSCTEADGVEYSGLIPRIYALCRRHKLSHQPLSVLYAHILDNAKGDGGTNASDWLYDLRAFCQAVSVFYEVDIPADLRAALPSQWRFRENASAGTGHHIRLLVTEWNDDFLYGYDAADATQTRLTVLHTPEWHLAEQLYPFATLNLVDVVADDRAILHPRLIVLEPDYLVDITSVCQCVKPCGNTPLYYLLDKFMPHEDTAATLLGNVANQFLDDILNGECDFRTSMQKSFKDYALKYCTTPGIDNNFFRQCQLQHANIQQTVSQLFPQAGINIGQDKIQLEPSFVCNVLGLQGRLDLLTGDCSKIVELKSGRRDDFRQTYKPEHALQMALYKEMLHYALGHSRSEITTLLLYSCYPQLYDIRLGHTSIVEALILRNGIVHIDRQLRHRCGEFLTSLTEEDFNPLHADSKLYRDYIRPRILSFLNTLHHASSLAFAYFSTMVAFVQREQFHAKVGDDRPDSDRGFAQAWLCDAETKQLHGNLIFDLSLCPIANEQGMVTHFKATPLKREGLEETNFREGDGVVLYERDTESDLLTNHQSVRCNIEEIRTDCLLLRLSHPQRQLGCFHEQHLYAIEPSSRDSLFGAEYRGLFALLTCPANRQALLLGERLPQVDDAAPLPSPVIHKHTQDLMGAVLQTEDYYLLVGPPGSGKTSVALSDMVEQLLVQDKAYSILLMAYTNRAVDEICQMLEKLPSQPAYMRIGQELSCGREYRSHLLQRLTESCPNRQQLLSVLSPIRVVCGTVSSLAALPELFRLKNFRTAILDEASQVLEPQLLPLLCATIGGKPAIQRFIMIGDHRQLPAVVVQSPQLSGVDTPLLRAKGLYDCRQSLFERLYRLATDHRCTASIGMLTRQGRMHEDINQFVASAYYNDRLQILPLPHQTASLDWLQYDVNNELESLVAQQRMGLIDVPFPTTEHSDKTNKIEAQQVGLLVAALHRLHESNHIPWNPEVAVGIVVPFRAQATLVRGELQRQTIPLWEQITVDTVERFQGSQRDVILFSTVIRRPYQLRLLSEPVEVDGSPVDRKLNVAITRARKQFFLVGNLALLRQATDYRHLIEYIQTDLLCHIARNR